MTPGIRGLINGLQQLIKAYTYKESGTHDGFDSRKRRVIVQAY
jgi:hypothetical protein